MAWLLVGCSLVSSLLPTTSPPVGIGVSNGTTLDVTLVVNGIVVRVFAPGSGTPDPITASTLGPMPWVVEARSSSGRVLTKMTVNPGDVAYQDLGSGQSSARGVGGRVDLSCGRLDIYAGPPMMGPAPGPGVPGDCVP